MDTIHFLSEQHIFLFLIQIFVLLTVAKLLSGFFQKWGWPALVGEILCGVLLGPTILGRVFPSLYTQLFPADLIQQNMMETISWFGVLFLLLVTGFEVRLSSIWKQGKTAVTVGVVGVFIPILIGCIIFYGLPEKYWGAHSSQMIFILLMSTAAAISAIPVIAKILHDMEILKSDLGLTTLSAFVINDILGWLLFTVVLGLTVTGQQNHLVNPLRAIFEIILFGALCLTLGNKIVGRITKTLKKTSLPQTATILTFITCLAMVCGIITQWIGIHAILGFFLAGIMAGNTEEISERTREIISQMVHAIFVPIFFVSIGIKIDFVQNFDVFLVTIFTFVAIVGKFFGAWFGGVLSKMSKEDSISIGIAHIPGGAMEIIIGMLAFELNLISEHAFVAIVFAAISSSIAVGPLLAWSINRRQSVNIGHYLLKGAVEVNLKGTTKWEAIEELSDLVAEQMKDLDREKIVSAVMEREKTMGTSLEKGVAIPHARLESLQMPVIAFGRSRLGIDWDSRDGHLTRLIFLILTPAEDEGMQLQILAAVARYMSQPNVHVKMMGMNDTGKVYDALKHGLKFKNQKK